MAFQQSSNFSPITRRHLLSLVGGAIAYPSLQGAALQATAQTRELQTNFKNPAVQTEISPKWIRVTFGGEVIADSRRVLIVLERGRHTGRARQSASGCEPFSADASPPDTSRHLIRPSLPRRRGRGRVGHSQHRVLTGA